MKWKEVCEKTRLTRKAVEYYQKKGLISPETEDNGYREFSEQDLFRLERIQLFRRMGLTVDEIMSVLDGKGTTLQILQRRKVMAADLDRRKAELLKRLIQGETMEAVQFELDALERGLAVRSRLQDAFPGYFGRVVCLQFAPYLEESIQTDEQECAYQEILTFLDNMDILALPEDVQRELEQFDHLMSDEDITDMNRAKVDAFEDMDAWLKANEEFVRNYAEFKQTEEYRNSIAFRISEAIRSFCMTSGYYDVFIPAMRRLSPSYNEYCEKMLEANRILLKHIPEINP